MNLFENAACKGRTDLFFPDRESLGYAVDYDAARTICRSCPIRRQCLEYAQENREHHGMWGGLSPKERLRARGADRLPVRTHCLRCDRPFQSLAHNATFCSPSCRKAANRRVA